MQSTIVLGGRFRVFDDGRVNRIKNGIEQPAAMARTCKDGKYLRVSYTVNHKQKQVYVHRLVAMTFVPNPDDLPEVNHIDGNTRNNAASNLEWVTRQENANHAIRTGLSNEMATANPCKVCGRWTLNENSVCPKCFKEIQRDAARIDRIARQSDRFSLINLDRCGPRQAEYIAYAMMGFTSSEIARMCGVSKQCVNEALHKAESSMSPKIGKTAQNEVVILLRKIERAKSKIAQAESSYNSGVSSLNEAENRLYELASLYGITVDDLLKPVQDSA